MEWLAWSTLAVTVCCAVAGHSRALAATSHITNPVAPVPERFYSKEALGAYLKQPDTLGRHGADWDPRDVEVLWRDLESGVAELQVLTTGQHQRLALIKRVVAVDVFDTQSCPTNCRMGPCTEGCQHLLKTTVADKDGVKKRFRFNFLSAEVQSGEEPLAVTKRIVEEEFIGSSGLSSEDGSASLDGLRMLCALDSSRLRDRYGRLEEEGVVNAEFDLEQWIYPGLPLIFTVHLAEAYISRLPQMPFITTSVDGLETSLWQWNDAYIAKQARLRPISTLMFGASGTLVPAEVVDFTRLQSLTAFLVKRFDFSEAAAMQLLADYLPSAHHSPVEALLRAKADGRFMPLVKFDAKNMYGRIGDFMALEANFNKVRPLGLRERLARLPPSTKLAVLSNEPRNYVLKLLEVLKLRELFPDHRPFLDEPSVFGIEDLPSLEGVPLGKPAPRAIVHALNQATATRMATHIATHIATWSHEAFGATERSPPKLPRRSPPRRCPSPQTPFQAHSL